MPSGLVIFRRANVGGVGRSEFTADVLTGGTAPPQVTLHGNSGFPEVKDFYARAIEVSGGTGRYKVVRVHMRFHQAIAPSANAISVNIFQEDASQFTYPWLSLVAASDDSSGNDVNRILESDTALPGCEA